MKEFLWSWIQDNDHCYRWNSVASLSSSRFQSSFWATISFILWQWFSKIYCSKSSVSWAHQTYKNRLSHCWRKIEEASHPFASHFHYGATNIHLYQSLRSSVFQEYLFQTGSHQYLLPSLQGVSEDMDTRLLEGN